MIVMMYSVATFGGIQGSFTAFRMTTGLEQIYVNVERLLRLLVVIPEGNLRLGFAVRGSLHQL